MRPRPSASTVARYVLCALGALAYIIGLARCSSHPVNLAAGARGCIFKLAVRSGEQTVLYEPAVVVGVVEGKDELWIDLPTRERLHDLNGTARAWNWPRDHVLLRGEVRLIDNRVCRCPDTF